MDPRTKWSGRDWLIASVYFKMLKGVPPGENYIDFYVYCQKHKNVSYTRVMKTIKEILAYKRMLMTEQDRCIGRKIAKLWKLGFKSNLKRKMLK